RSKFGWFSAEGVFWVIGREGDRNKPAFARRHADELILKTRDEGSGSDVDPDIAACPTLERRPVDLAGEVDSDPIALLHLGARGSRHVGFVLLGALAERVGHLVLAHLGVAPLRLDALEVAAF